MPTIDSLWTSIEDNLKRLRPEAHASLNGPAEKVVIEEFNETSGIPLLEEIEAYLHMCDGQASDEWPIYAEWSLLPLRQIMDTLQQWEGNENAQVIPFASNGAGDFLCLQVNRADETRPVVAWSHEGHEFSMVATDFAAWLEAVATSLRVSSLVTASSSEALRQVPTMDGLASVVGRSIEDQEARRILCAPDTQGDDDQDAGPSLSNVRDGYEVQLNRSGTIEVIHIYVIPKDGFAAYTGKLAQDLVPTDGYETVRERLGEPTRTGVVPTEPGGWDRFDSEHVCVRFGYDRVEGGIGMITLMAPAIAP